MNEQNALPINGAEISRRFSEDGYYFPIIAFSEQEAAFDVEQLHSLESRNQGRPLGNKGQINLPHVIFRFADDIVRNSRILDAVEAIIGPDILVWGSTFFIKEPHSETYISWHQDLRYWGLDGDAEVSAWVALTRVTVANGCMRFLPGSHKGEMLPHRDTFSEDNFLTRGQEAEIEIDETDTINVPLRPGQVSLHHGKLLHASPPNRSDKPRIGLSINYIAPHMRQLVAKEDFAVLVRGEDKYGHFQHVPSPKATWMAMRRPGISIFCRPRTPRFMKASNNNHRKSVLQYDSPQIIDQRRRR